MKKVRSNIGRGDDYTDAQNKPPSVPPQRNCKNCGTPTTQWPLCPTCYRWRIHFNATRLAMLAIRGKL